MPGAYRTANRKLNSLAKAAGELHVHPTCLSPQKGRPEHLGWSILCRRCILGSWWMLGYGRTALSSAAIDGRLYRVASTVRQGLQVVAGR